MNVDVEALSDRLSADALGACLRSPIAFCCARGKVGWEPIERYVRERAEVHRKDLSATAAQAEEALEVIRAEWYKMPSHDGEWREIDLLTGAARKFLQPSGAEMLLRVDRHAPGREILRWRFVSLALPPGILIAAATEPKGIAPSAVRILNPSMAPDGPVAQNHLHHAALPAFEDVWASIRIRALTQQGDFTQRLRERSAFCPGLHREVCLAGKDDAQKRLTVGEEFARAQHMAEWADLIRQAFIARRVIECHSLHGEALAVCADAVCDTGRKALQAFMGGRKKTNGPGGTVYPWKYELLPLARKLRQVKVATVSRRLAGASTDLLRLEAADERGILVRAFAHLGPEAYLDPEFETLFLQYLRVKTAIFGLLVHSPGQRGLEKFLQHFSQIKVYAPESDILPPRKPVEPGLDVRATEYRVAPNAWLDTFRRENEIEKELGSSERAWLIHFKRAKAGREMPLYSGAIRRMENEASMIANALDQEPTRLRLLRGIDICGVEGWQPLWVSAQTLLRLRARSRATAAWRPGLRLEPLRLTIHAGEDFKWLTSGMRAIAEPFRWSLIERGDRVGHGIAITLEPKGWWDRHKGEVIEVKPFDRLLDLAFLDEYAKERSPEQRDWLRFEVERIAKHLWPEVAKSPLMDLAVTAKEVWRHLGGPVTRRLMSSTPPDVSKPHEDWLYKYLWQRSTRQRAETLIRMKVDDDGNAAKTGSHHNERDLLILARAELIREIARWQVCLETNPSSNLVVGSLDSMASQDFLQTRPTKVTSKGRETLTWTISTDDPITFSTTLADEYAYAWAGMVLRKVKPYDPSYARALLDEAAATSMRMKFTLSRPDQLGPNRGIRQGNRGAPRN